LPEDNVSSTKTSPGSESYLQASMEMTRIVPPGVFGKVLGPGKKEYLTTSSCIAFLPTTFMTRWNMEGNILPKKCRNYNCSWDCISFSLQCAQQWRVKNNLALVTFLDCKIKLMKT